MTATSPATSHFGPLTEQECEDLLASHSMGRVAWTAADGPMVLPVTYQMYAGDIAFRTSPYGLLSGLVAPTNVAFEIDGLDEEHQTGWSVVARGRAQTVTNSAILAGLWRTEGVAPWASGTRNLFISIKRHSTTGRALKGPSAD
ncbi:MAG: hypothetical protein JWP61_2375 [Friedmanniella sp.]|nr:hypothetical protein [Friedmanniella sp.]